MKYLEYNGNKMYEDQEKERIFKEIWSKIFKISPEEIRDSDINTEEQINNYLRQQQHRLNIHNAPNLERLQEENYLLKKIAMTEVKNITKKTKNTRLGDSKIKKILSEIPYVAILVQRLIGIYDTLSLGHFPPKKSKDPP